MKLSTHTRSIGTAAIVTAGIVTAFLSRTASAQDLTFVRWTEPTEKAFSIQVPKGWNVSGGLKRTGKDGMRESVIASAPGQEMVAAIGDPAMPTFTVPTPAQLKSGIQEGSVAHDGDFTLYYMHYLSALEFNRMYLRSAIGSKLDNFAITSQSEDVNTERQLAARLNASSGGIHYIISVASTRFSGRNKKTGRKIVGVLTSTTKTIKVGTVAGRTWTAQPTLAAGLDEAKVKTATAVLQKMENTWKYDPTWSAKENKRIAQMTQ